MPKQPPHPDPQLASKDREIAQVRRQITTAKRKAREAGILVHKLRFLADAKHLTEALRQLHLAYFN